MDKSDFLNLFMVEGIEDAPIPTSTAWSNNQQNNIFKSIHNGMP